MYIHNNIIINIITYTGESLIVLKIPKKDNLMCIHKSIQDTFMALGYGSVIINIIE